MVFSEEWIAFGCWIHSQECPTGFTPVSATLGLRVSSAAAGSTDGSFRMSLWPCTSTNDHSPMCSRTDPVPKMYRRDKRCLGGRNRTTASAVYHGASRLGWFGFPAPTRGNSLITMGRGQKTPDRQKSPGHTKRIRRSRQQ